MKNISIVTLVLFATALIFACSKKNKGTTEEMIPITVIPGEIEHLNPDQWSELIYSTNASVFITGACTEKLQLLSKQDILQRIETEGELIRYQTFKFRCQNTDVRLEVLDVEAYVKSKGFRSIPSIPARNPLNPVCPQTGFIVIRKHIDIHHTLQTGASHRDKLTEALTNMHILKYLGI